MDVSGSVSSVFLLYFYPKVPRKIAGGTGGSMKTSYNLLPARAVSCEKYYLLMLADLFCKFAKPTLFPDFSLEITVSSSV